MIRINNIKLNPGYEKTQLDREIRRALGLKTTPEYTYSKVSIDNREKNHVKYIVSVDVKAANEQKLVKKVNSNNVMLTKKTPFILPQQGTCPMKHPPLIVGAGPAGLFAGLMLARAGFQPIILERGMDVDRRTKAVTDYWEGRSNLLSNCNVQFGEGGAGTFSDGKLNTVVKDKSGIRTKVMETFVEFGADPSILYLNKPHVGTDVLSGIVKNMRNEIIRLGGQVLFDTCFTGYEIIDKNTCYVTAMGGQRSLEFKTNALILAIGHSARDTFELLYQSGMAMSRKPFAMGLRIEHSRSLINRLQYGDKKEYETLLPAADYKLTHQASGNRAVYSFCMCPGGYVVNASSEPGRICVNGMSYSGRKGRNSNSAIVVSVTPDDFGSDNPLAGMYFQRHYEELACLAGDGCIPVQLFSDFRKGIPSEKTGSIIPAIKGKYRLTNLKSCLPEYINNAIIEGILSFDRHMPGFADGDACLSGIEARTSSPVRIERGDDLTSSGTCIYPCGEGAGYAGGITSAACDGIRTACAVISKYQIMF